MDWGAFHSLACVATVKKKKKKRDFLFLNYQTGTLVSLHRDTAAYVAVSRATLSEFVGFEEGEEERKGRQIPRKKKEKNAAEWCEYEEE